MKKTLFFFSLALVFFLFVLMLPPPSQAQTQREERSNAVQLVKQGQEQYRNRDFRGAINSWERALSIFQRLGEKNTVALLISITGDAYRDSGDFRKAMGYYEQASAIDEEIGDKKGRWIVLQKLGSLYRDLGDFRKALVYHEKTLAIAEALEDKERQKESFSDIAVAYSNLGEYWKAIEYHKKALLIAEEMGDKKSRGIHLGNLGLEYDQLGDFRKAIGYYENALAIAEETGNKKGKSLYLNHLGIVNLQLGDFGKAIGYYEKALMIAEEIGDKRGKSNILGNLANAFTLLGDYSKAVPYYEKALAIAEEIGDKKGKARRLNNLGALLINMGDYEKSISCYIQSIALSKEMDAPYEITEGNLGDAFLAVDRDFEALAIYTKQNHPVRLGRYHLKRKDFQKAREQFDRDRAKYERGKIVTMVIAQWIGLGLSHEGLKEYDKAYTWYTKAIDFIEGQREALTPAEREHYFEGKEFGIARIEAYEGAVRCAYMLNRLDEAFYWAENTRGRVLSELLARRHSGESRKIPLKLSEEEEDLTAQIMLNKKQQQDAFQKNNPNLVRQAEIEYPALRQRMNSLIDRLRKEYPQYAAIKYPQPVKLSQLGLKKGETIVEYEVTDSCALAFVIREGNVIKAFRIEKTRKELEALVKRFRTPFQEGQNLNEFSLNLAKEMAELLLTPALSVLAKGERLIIIPDESLSLIPFESLLLAAPTDVLKEEAVLLARVNTQTDTGTVDKQEIIRGLTRKPATRGRGISVSPRVTTNIMFDVGSARISKESLKQMEEIVSALKGSELINASIRIEGHTDSTGDPRYNLKLSYKRAQAVYEYLVNNGITINRLSYTGKGDTEPLAENTTDKGRRLNRRVDFVRVTDTAPSSPLKGIVFAMDAYPISYYQSASVLSLHRGLQIDRTKEKTFFGLGDPVYDTQDRRSTDLRSVAIVKKPSSDVAPQVADTHDEGYRFARLVNTEKEVNEVGKLFPQSRILAGFNASEEKVKAENLKQHRYILFSTHGILGNEIPYIKQPALVLNLIGNEKEDGFLTASEIFNLECNADIIILSACQTGLGIQSAGEGVVGLSRAFMYAGTDTVLVSLWSVADESTYKLMVRFFEGLKNGKDKLTALTEAKNYLRANGYDHPFYWAPFILMGEAK